jgi:hypothetical protein
LTYASPYLHTEWFAWAYDCGGPFLVWARPKIQATTVCFGLWNTSKYWAVISSLSLSFLRILDTILFYACTAQNGAWLLQCLLEKTLSFITTHESYIIESSEIKSEVAIGHVNFSVFERVFI